MRGSIDRQKSVKFSVDGQDIQLHEVDIMSVIDSSFVYPSYKSLKDKEITEVPPKLVFHYKCDSSKCEFPITALKESVDLKSVGIKETAEVIVRTIDNNQQLFTARQCGGYIFQAAGKPLVLLHNDSVTPYDDTRFGFLDLTEVRRRLIHSYELSKLRTESKKAAPPATSELLGSAALGAAVLYGGLKLFKKI